ncbi:MAG: hypothetical protein AVDCRST_MAG66-3653, partial [uncultured Pseudonocardia sp.]
ARRPAAARAVAGARAPGRALGAAHRAVRGGGRTVLVGRERPRRAHPAVLRADRGRHLAGAVAGQPAAPRRRAGGRGQPRRARRRPADLADRQRGLADHPGRGARHGGGGVRRRGHAAGGAGRVLGRARGDAAAAGRRQRAGPLHRRPHRRGHRRGRGGGAPHRPGAAGPPRGAGAARRDRGCPARHGRRAARAGRAEGR